jgi:hypothetical protein
MSEMCLHSCILIVFLRLPRVVLYMLLVVVVVVVFIFLSTVDLVCIIFFSFGTITA